MKPLPFIIFGVYILLFVLTGFIFGAMPVVKALAVMFILATIIYIWILVEEKPWKFAFVGENLVAYALMAYGIVFLIHEKYLEGAAPETVVDTYKQEHGIS